MARGVAVLAVLAMPAIASAFANIFSTDCELTYYNKMYCPLDKMLTYNGFTVTTAPSVLTSPTAFSSEISGLVLNDQGSPPGSWAALSRACSECCRSFSGIKTRFKAS